MAYRNGRISPSKLLKGRMSRDFPGLSEPIAPELIGLGVDNFGEFWGKPHNSKGCLGANLKFGMELGASEFDDYQIPTTKGFLNLNQKAPFPTDVEKIWLTYDSRGRNLALTLSYVLDSFDSG